MSARTALPIIGSEIPRRILHALQRDSHSVWIVSPYLTDHEFRPLKTVSALLTRAVARGATVKLLTTPPPGRSEERNRKEILLDLLVRRGVEVLVNEKLHAKVYLVRGLDFDMAMVGSANLTTPAMEELLELAWLSYQPALRARTEVEVERLAAHPKTMPFNTWRIRTPKSRGETN